MRKVGIRVASVICLYETVREQIQLIKSNVSRMDVTGKPRLYNKKIIIVSSSMKSFSAKSSSGIPNGLEGAEGLVLLGSVDKKKEV